MPDHDDAGPRPPVAPVPAVEPDPRAQGQFIVDGEASGAEIGYYEAFSDPLVRRVDEMRRRRTGQYLRRMRRRPRPPRQ